MHVCCPGGKGKLVVSSWLSEAASGPGLLKQVKDFVSVFGFFIALLNFTLTIRGRGREEKIGHQNF